jgi:hypothetical protein
MPHTALLASIRLPTSNFTLGKSGFPSWPRKTRLEAIVDQWSATRLLLFGGTSTLRRTPNLTSNVRMRRDTGANCFLIG